MSASVVRAANGRPAFVFSEAGRAIATREAAAVHALLGSCAASDHRLPYWAHDEGLPRLADAAVRGLLEGLLLLGLPKHGTKD